jgi:hypothetical protein
LVDPVFVHTSNVTTPDTGAVHAYQTLPWPFTKWFGSSVSVVAPIVVPVAEVEVPLSGCAEAKASLVGAAIALCAVRSRPAERAIAATDPSDAGRATTSRG